MLRYVVLPHESVYVSPKHNYGDTPLHGAVEFGHEAVVKLLLEQEDVDVNFEKDRGDTLLRSVAKNGYLAAIKLLLQKQGVHLDLEDNDGNTLLRFAATNEHGAVFEVLEGLRQPETRKHIEINKVNSNMNKIQLARCRQGSPSIRRYRNIRRKSFEGWVLNHSMAR